MVDGEEKLFFVELELSDVRWRIIWNIKNESTFLSWCSFLVLIQFGCVYQPVYHDFIASSVSGRVVDRRTGAPIENAVVAIHWQLESGGVHSSGPGGIVYWEEASTDENGEYIFQEWGPMKLERNDYFWGADPFSLFL